MNETNEGLCMSENIEYSQESINTFWNLFLKATNRKQTTSYSDVFHFAMTKDLANALLTLVLNNKKKATASSLWGHTIENEKIPEIGDLSIVTDWEGIPHCVIETTAVTIIPFSEMTYDVCKREGEDDTLESWQRGHTNFFIEEGHQIGYEFSEDMPVVFVDFKVVYPL